MTQSTSATALMPLPQFESAAAGPSITEGLAALDGLLDEEREHAFRYDIALVGLGYVGLPTALAFHAAGKRVLGLDISAHRLAAIRDVRVDLLDSDKARLQSAIDDARFTLSGELPGLSLARAVIIAVPTPIDEHLLPDLGILRSACAAVVQHAVAGQVIILTSTTYVGSTAEMLVEPLRERGLIAGEDIFVAFSPERIDPGNDGHAHEDVARVVGGVTTRCAQEASAVIASYARNLHMVSSSHVAEMTKLFENSFRAVNIALANELAEISRTLNLDVVEVVEAAATKPYGFMPFFPGPGVGGHCIPCDPHYLLWQLRTSRQPTPIIEQAMSAIAGRPIRVVERAREVLSGQGRGLSGSRVLLLGVAYKPDVEDVRESPALEIYAGLCQAGALVSYHDPFVRSIRLADGTTCYSVDDPASIDADLVIVHTLHRRLDLTWLPSARLVLDASYRLRDLPQRVAL